MSYKTTKTRRIILILILLASFSGKSQNVCTWNQDKKEMEFNLSEISGILNCDSRQNHGKSHHFNNVIHKPTGMKVSPDGERMAGAGMLNFFRVLIEGGYPCAGTGNRRYYHDLAANNSSSG